jgi:hypothetical protein
MWLKKKKNIWAGCRWLMPVILATQEVEIRRIVVWSQFRQIERPYLQKILHKKKKRWWNGSRCRFWIQAPNCQIIIIIMIWVRHWWLLATQGAAIRRIIVWIQPEKSVLKTLSWKKPNKQNSVGGVALVVQCLPNSRRPWVQTPVLSKKMVWSWAGWQRPIIPILGRLRQEDHEFKASHTT